MNNEQKLLLKLLSKNFSILNSKELLTSSLQTNPSEQTFYRNDTGEIFIKLDDSQIFCNIFSLDTPMPTILNACEHNKPLLFTMNGDIIGYTSSTLLLSNLFTEHIKANIFFDTILNTIDESCTVIDENQNILYWTKGAEELFTLKERDVLGRPITDFFLAEHLEILNSLQKGTSIQHAQHQPREDLVVRINSNPVIWRDTIIGAVVSEENITNQIRLNNELYETSEKLFSLEEEVRKVKNADNPFTYIKGNSPTLKKTLERVKKAATTHANILINGESGVGKELFAKAIHTIREDDKAPFIAINCGAIPPGLFESEIFGYEKGAFSGADQKGKKGKVELAKGGTLFLDEIGEMPLDMQVKILRLLQEKKFYPVGGTKEIEVDFHVVAATNRDLMELIKEGKFREDLYYRLNVVNIKIPALRERISDIIELTHYFLYEISIKYNRPVHGISQDILQNLMGYSWPGNIRELKNVVERLVVFSDNGIIKSEDLPIELHVPSHTNSKKEESDSLKQFDSLPLNLQLQEYEKDILLKELHKADGNKNTCAKNLGITRATLYNRLNKLGIK
ncbi:sigma-54 interaction domain-containing protein [Viridibacillus arvi]|uniref:sigma-54 interaction domain-containing protein n=1 Tax=Viridibacillus arvi TaxID=263475 RepID=UPI003D2CDDA7